MGVSREEVMTWTQNSKEPVTGGGSRKRRRYQRDFVAVVGAIVEANFRVSRHRKRADGFGAKCYWKKAGMEL